MIISFFSFSQSRKISDDNLKWSKFDFEKRKMIEVINVNVDEFVIMIKIDENVINIKNKMKWAY